MTHQSAMRRTVVLVLEGLLLLTVLVTAAYYLVLAFDDGQTFNMRLLAGWIAFIFAALTFAGPIRNRIERRGGEAAWDYATLFYGGVIFLMILTFLGIGMDAKKNGATIGALWVVWLICGMFFWPDLRHRIQTGAWRD